MFEAAGCRAGTIRLVEMGSRSANYSPQTNLPKGFFMITIEAFSPSLSLLRLSNVGKLCSGGDRIYELFRESGARHGRGQPAGDRLRNCSFARATRVENRDHFHDGKN